MIEVLAAAATDTVIQVPGPVTTYGPWGILIALGGWKGIAQGILWLQGRNGNGNGNGKYNSELCKRLHAEIDKDRDETREEIRELRKESRENFQTVFNKIDGLHDRQGRNPN